MAVASTPSQHISGLMGEEDSCFSSKLSSTYTCAIGKHTLRIPVYQLKSCGHKICKRCFEDLLISRPNSTCPGNYDECSDTELNREASFPDLATDRELRKEGMRRDGFPDPPKYEECPPNFVATDIKDKSDVDSKLDLSWNNSKPVFSVGRKNHKLLAGYRKPVDDDVYNGGHQESGNGVIRTLIPNTNGKLIFKIPNYRVQKDQAKNGKIPFIESMPFLSHNYGYQMCARVYLNGDDKGVGTHASLYFVIMKGEYDALLHWPFTRMITLGLCDQKNKVNDFLYAFRPDPNSTCYKKPVDSMNVATDTSLVVSHKKLESDTYLKDDTIFFKIEIDVTDIDQF